MDRMDTSKREKINPSSRYFRYRARFGFDNLADLPVLFEVRIYYDVSGMRRINNQNKKEVIQALGKYFEFFTISLLSPGVYFLIFKAGERILNKKLVILK